MDDRGHANRRSGLRRRAGAGAPSSATRLVAGAAALLLAGCVGATDRADFDAEVRRRGGGLTATLVSDALDLVAEEVGAASGGDVDVLTMSVNTSSRSVTVQARRADRPDFVDTVVVSDGRLVSSTPFQDADDLPLDELTIDAAELPLDDLEALGDRAIAELDLVEGFVTRVRVSIVDSRHVIDVAAESARQTGEVRFDLAGDVVEIDR